MANTNTLVSSNPSSTIPLENILIGWKNTETISEGHQTHSEYEIIEQDLNLKFDNTIISNVPHFTEGDVHTVGVCRGILKDNATQVANQFKIFWEESETCNAERLDLCYEEQLCLSYGGYWYSEDPDNKPPFCHAEEPCHIDHPQLCTSSQDCENIGGYWYNGLCHVDPNPYECSIDARGNCLTEEACTEVGGFWYGGVCNDSAPFVPTVIPEYKDELSCETNSGNWYSYTTHTTETTPTIVPNTGTLITEPVIWRGYSTVDVYSGGYDITPLTPSTTIISFQYVDENADMSFEFEVTDAGDTEGIGFSTATALDPYFGFRLFNDATIKCFDFDNPVVEQTDAGLASNTYAVGDKFKVSRTSGVLTYYKNDILIATSAMTSSSRLWVSAKLTLDSNTMINGNVTYELPQYVISIGNETNKTGVWEVNYKTCETTKTQSMVVKVDGVEVDIVTIRDNTRLDQWTNLYPSIGEVYYSPSAGKLMFNPTFINLTVSVDFKVDKYPACYVETITQDACTFSSKYWYNDECNETPQ